MRYFIVTYRQVMRGKGRNMAPQTDEEVSVSRKLKMRDLQTAAVILDFQDRKVVQASLAGTTIPRDWTKIRDFYHQHYAKVIDDLENLYGHTAPSSLTSDRDPITN